MIESLNELKSKLALGTTQHNTGGAVFRHIGCGYHPAFAGVTTQPVLVLTTAAAPWVFEAAQQLEALGRLNPGWDSYGGLPLTPEAKVYAIEAIQSLECHPLPTPNVVLGSSGAVGLEWRRAGKELDLDIGSEELIAFATSDRQGNLEEGTADRYAVEKLNSLADWLLDREPLGAR